MMKIVLPALALLVATGTAGAQGVSGPWDLQQIRDATPSCRANPDAPWVGRVAGFTEFAFDRRVPVSFVGCFYDQGTCERWKSRTSGIITSPLTQYSCTIR